MSGKPNLAAGIAVSLALVFSAGVYAHPGEGRGMGEHMQGGMQHEGGHGKQHGMRRGAERGEMRGHGEGQAQHGPQGMSAEERAAFHEKMRNATPEERRKLADARRAEMHQRMQAHSGMQRGPRGGATNEHAH